MNATTHAAINNLRRVVLYVLQQIGHGSADGYATIDTASLGEDNPILNYPNLGIWVGYGPEYAVETRTILGRKLIPGYAVGVYRTINNYPNAPDDVEEVELLRTISLQKAAQGVVHALINDICDNVMGAMAAENSYEGE